MKIQKLQASNSITEGFLRLHQIVGRRAVTEEEAEQNRLDAELAKKSGKEPNKKPKRTRDSIPAIFPISKSAWWAGVKEGKYPAPIKLGPRTTVWDVRKIRAVVEQQNGNGGGI